MLQFLTFDPMIPNSGNPIRRRSARSAMIMVLTLLTTAPAVQAQPRAEDNTTPTWNEAIAAFTALASEHPERASMAPFGKSDVGRPLHLFTMGPDSAGLHILVNNAIHPGEPCGVNASIEWATALLENPEGLPEDVRIGIVPMYNVGGGLRRNCCTRANQNGPEEYGFRGNARNLDLNRDFIKCDSRNALSFNAMFTDFAPDIFVDTHTSNGADYQPAITLISTQPDKLGGKLGTWMEQEFDPLLYSGMSDAGHDMIPYVNSLGTTPDDKGICDFLETPRYSTGYGALHHAIGYTTEAHMLKSFPERVAATRAFLDVLLHQAIPKAADIRRLRNEQHAAFVALDETPVSWSLDTTAIDHIEFPGYEARFEWSSITGEKRLRYDHEAPFSRSIPRLHTYTGDRMTRVPGAFIVPQAWRHVIERLEANRVRYHRIPKDTTWVVETAHIIRHKASSRPYEGHHYRTVEEVERRMESVSLYQGDLVIPVDQPAARYLVETLSPEGVDAFMAWNFFDSALQQKEYFSSYVFEETAVQLLESDPELKEAFEEAKSSASQDAPWSARRQLDWIYRHSPHFEQTPSRYPVFFIPKGKAIPFHE